MDMLTADYRRCMSEWRKGSSLDRSRWIQFLRIRHEDVRVLVSCLAGRDYSTGRLINPSKFRSWIAVCQTLTMELSKNMPTETQLLKSKISEILYWPKRIDWINVIFLVALPVWAAYQALYTPLRLNTFLLSVFFYSFTGISVTAGYHRLWSHTSYLASWPLRLTFALGGAAAFQHSIRWWATKHRAHHRFTDTSKDPYAAHLGFWHAHMGWLIFKQDQKIIGRVNVYDLDQVSKPFDDNKHNPLTSSQGQNCNVATQVPSSTPATPWLYASHQHRPLLLE